MAGSVKAGGAFIDIEARDKTSKVLKAVRGKLLKAGSSLMNMGSKFAGIGGSLAAPLAGAVTHFTQTGTALARISAQTGNSVTDISKLTGAAQNLGIPVDDVVGSMEELNIRLGEAVRDGTGPLAETFKHLGIDSKEFAELPVTEQYEQLADVLSGIEDRSERQFAADEIFGGDAFKIMPLLEQGGEALAGQLKDIKGWTEEDAKSASQLSKTWNKTTAAFWRVVDAVGGALAPVFQTVLEKALPLIEMASDWISNNKQLVQSVFGVVAGITAFGGSLIAAGGTLAGVAAVLGGFGTALTFILNPATLIVGGLLAAGGAALYFSGVLGEMKEGALATFMELGETVKTSMKAVQDAMSAGDFTLAGNILWTSLKLLWAQGTSRLMDKWTEFKFGTAGAFVELWNGIKVGFINFADWIAKKILALSIEINATILENMQALLSKIQSLVGADLFFRLNEQLGGNLTLFQQADFRGAGETYQQERQERTDQLLSDAAQQRQGLLDTLSDMMEEEKKVRRQGIADLKKTLADQSAKAAAAAKQQEPAVEEGLSFGETMLNALGDSFAAASDRIIAMADGIDMSAVAAAAAGGPGPQAIQALDKGSMAAVEQFLANRSNQSEKKIADLVGINEQILNAADRIADNTESDARQFNP